MNIRSFLPSVLLALALLAVSAPAAAEEATRGEASSADIGSPHHDATGETREAEPLDPTDLPDDDTDTDTPDTEPTDPEADGRRDADTKPDPDGRPGNDADTTGPDDEGKPEADAQGPRTKSQVERPTIRTPEPDERTEQVGVPSLWVRFINDPRITDGALRLNGTDLQKIAEANASSGGVWRVISPLVASGALTEIESKQILFGSPLAESIYELVFTSRASAETVVAELRGQLRYAEFDFVPEPLTNDPLFPQQWSLPTADVLGAWDLEPGSGAETVIAIVDRGIRADHEDLADIWWTNPGESGPDGSGADMATNGIDDDGNGYIDDHFALVDTAGSVWAAWSGHGTKVGGLAGAISNNGLGVASPNDGSLRIMPIEMWTHTPGNYVGVFAGIEYAIVQGADVLSMSFASGQSGALNDLLAIGVDLGTTHFAAAGNNGTQNVLYPAVHPDVIAIGGTLANGTRAGWSQHGPDIGLFAPGGGLRTTNWPTSSSYSGCGGTSCASPFAAGVAGLMLAHNPGLSPDQVREMMGKAAYSMDAANQADIGLLGAGAVDACNSVALALGIDVWDVDWPCVRCPATPINWHGWQEPTLGPDGRIYFATDDSSDDDRLAVIDPDTFAMQVLTYAVDGVEHLAADTQRIYFAADGSGVGPEIHAYDTGSGSLVLLEDIDPGGSGSDPEGLHLGPDGNLYFSADDGDHGRELWTHDPVSGTTTMVGDFRPGGAGFKPRDFAWIGDTLYMQAKVTGSIGYELYSWTIGDAAVTLAADLRPGAASSRPIAMTAVGDHLVFAAKDDVAGRELRVLDTSSGVVMTADVRAGSSSGVESAFTSTDLAIHGGDIFFAADDGTHGDEVWRADITTGAASLAFDLDLGSSGADIEALAAVDHGIVVSAETSEEGDELWRYFSSVDVVTLIHSRDGWADSDPEELLPFDGRIYFDGEDEDETDKTWCVEL